MRTRWTDDHKEMTHASLPINELVMPLYNEISSGLNIIILLAIEAMDVRRQGVQALAFAVASLADWGMTIQTDWEPEPNQVNAYICIYPLMKPVLAQCWDVHRAQDDRQDVIVGCRATGVVCDAMSCNGNAEHRCWIPRNPPLSPGSVASNINRMHFQINCFIFAFASHFTSSTNVAISAQFSCPARRFRSPFSDS